jgi:hypothetical protein
MQQSPASAPSGKRLRVRSSSGGYGFVRLMRRQSRTSGRGYDRKRDRVPLNEVAFPRAASLQTRYRRYGPVVRPATGPFRQSPKGIWSICISLIRSLDAKHFGHSDEVRERASLHFSHDLPAMYFHGNFADLQPVGHVLVHQAGDDQREDFALARR